MRIATVFSGIGAPEEALKQLGVDFEIVFACDNGERELSQTYDEIVNATDGMSADERYQYVLQLYLQTKKENKVKKSYMVNNALDEDHWYEDVRFIDGTRYRDQVDIFIGGSPCQSFSTYGKKKGFEDARGTLFYDYARLIQEIQPKVFIYENVPGLLTHDKGQTWRRIQEIFDELNYDIFMNVLDSSKYGLPQYRKRVFVVGFNRALGVVNFEPPHEIELTTKATDYLEKNVPLSYYLGQKGFEWVTMKEKHDGRSRVNREIIGCQTANQQFNWTGDFRLETPSEAHRNDPRIYVGQYYGEEKVARKLTPRECLNLMGFSNFVIDVDDNSIYRQSGNSIAVPVLKALFLKIFEYVEF